MQQINSSDSYRIKGGDFWIKAGKALTREEVIQEADYQNHNLIVDVASDLIASWAFQGLSPAIPGILTLAVGTGQIGWDLQNPPAPTTAQTLLFSELARKQFASQTYIDPILFTPVVGPTNIIDFTTTFLTTEAVGPLVEMGLFGGVGATGVGGGTMVNYVTFKVINKPNTSQLTIVWRLTF
jgi:hypothetical protein